MRANFHTHTWRCRHAQGTPSDYCAEAVKKQIGELAFTDHVPYPDGLWEEGIRMPIAEMDAYFAEIRQAQKDFPQLVIHSGFECEYRPELGRWFQEELLDPPGRCEFIILGMHSYRNRLGEWASAWRVHSNDDVLEYTEFLVQAMESGLYRFVAHPDIFAHAGCILTPTVAECCRRIVKTAIERDLPLEINANGLRKRRGYDDVGWIRRHYPFGYFWSVAATLGAKVLVNADAHAPEMLWDQAVEDAYAFRRFYFGNDGDDPAAARENGGGGLQKPLASRSHVTGGVYSHPTLGS